MNWRLIKKILKEKVGSIYLSNFPDDYYGKSDEEKVECLQSLISEVALENNERFIDLTITFKDGYILKYSEATLYHKWLNAADAIGLLKFAGISIEMPDLQDVKPEEQRELVTRTLANIQEGLQTIINVFRTKALACVMTQEPEVNTTLAKRYGSLFDKMHSEMQAQLDKSKTSESFKIQHISRNLLPTYERYLNLQKPKDDSKDEKKLVMYNSLFQ